MDEPELVTLAYSLLIVCDCQTDAFVAYLAIF